MKKYPIILFLFICFQIQAQVSKSFFDELIDYYNCRVTEYSVVSENNDFKCNCNGKISFDSILSAIPFSQTIELCKEIDRIKELEYKNTLNKSNIISLLFNTVINDKEKYGKLYAFNTSPKRKSNYVEFKNQLIEEITQKINQYFENERIIQLQKFDKTSSDQLTKINQIENELLSIKSQYQTLIIVFVVLLVFSIMLGLLMFLRNRSSKRDNSYRRSDDPPGYIKQYVQDKIWRETNNRFVTYDNFRNVQNEITNQFTELFKMVNEIKTNTGLVNKSVETTPVDSSNEIVIESKSKDVVFYMPTPNNDGSFNANFVQNSFIEGKSIYRFIKISENKAEFKIENNPASIKLAVQYPNDRIEPCCEPLNAYNHGSRSIVTEQNGIAELSNNIWRVVTKAKIRYEY